MGTIKMKDKNAETVENSAPELIEKAQELAVADESTVRQTVMQDDPAVRYEDEAQTDEQSRLYYLNNGTAKSVISAEPTNYFDEDAQAWKRIDNTLEDRGDAFVTKAGACVTEISKADVNKSVRMSKKDKEVSWVFLGKKPTVEKCALSVDAEHTETSATLRIENRAEKASSRAVYENAEAETDIEYCLQGNGLKENIIVKEKSDEYRYLFALNTKGLKMRLSEDNTRIELYSDEKTEFAIPAPYMYDANGVTSDEVYYELEPSDDGNYAFAVVADGEWINAGDRAFPVTIDPQIVTDGINAIIKQTQYRNIYSSSSSGISYSSWYNVSYQDIQAYRTSSAEYKTILTVNKSSLNILKNRVTSVKLKLTPTNTNRGALLINGNYKYFNTSDSEFVLDITSDFLTNSNSFTITIEAYNMYDDFRFSMTTNPPILEVEYLTNDKIKPCTREIELCDNAVGILDIPTGEFATEIATVDGAGLTLPYGVTHIFKRSGDDFGCGKNIRLNLHEKLEKTDTGALNSNYVYTDKYGNKHGLIENFYRVDDNNNKVSANKSSVTVDPDGFLHDSDGNEVFKEELSDMGLKVVTKYDGINGADLFEQRQDEIKQLEERIFSYENFLREYVVVDSATGNTVVRNDIEISLEKLDNASYIKFVEALGYDRKSGIISNNNYIPLTKSEQLQYANLLMQESELSKNLDCTMIIPSFTTCEKQMISLRSAFYELNAMLTEYVRHSNSGYKDQLLALMSNNNRNLVNDYVSKVFEDSTVYIGNGLPSGASEDQKNRQPKMTGKEIKEQFRQWHLYALQLDEQENDLKEKITAIRAQKESMCAHKETTIKQIVQYYKEYVNSMAELALRKKSMPVNYLTNGEIIKGFNENGDLVVIYDRYENAVAIERDNKNRICRVYDDKENAIVFKYNTKGRLRSITDARGKTTKFGYDGENLKSVKYADGKTLTLVCDDLLRSVESSEQVRAEISYKGKGTSLANVTYKSLVRSISHGNPVFGTDTLYSLSVNYTANQTAITTSDGAPKTETYRFDTNGNLSQYYLEENGKVTQAEKHEYEKGVKDHITYAKNSTLDKTPLSSFSFVEGEKNRTDLNKWDNLVKQVLSGEQIDINTTRTTTTEYEYNDDQKVIAEYVTVTTQYPDGITPASTTAYVMKQYFYNTQGSVVRTESGEANVKVVNETGEEIIWTFDAVKGKAIEETEYDEKGRVIKSCKYNTLDSSSKFYTETEYNEQGQTAADIDETGENKTEYEYAQGTNAVRAKKLPNGGKFAYGYDANGRVTGITQSTDDGEENSTQTAYTCGEVTELKSGNNVVRYEYDHKRRKTAVYLNDKNNAYVTYSYSADGKTATAKYMKRTSGNAKVEDMFTTVTDERGRITSASYNDMSQVSVEYNDAERQEVRKCKIGESQVTTTIQYDALDRIDFVKTNGVQTEKYTYNSDGQTATKTVAIGDVNTVYEYKYKKNVAKDLDYIKLDNIALSPQSDCLGRYTGKEICAVTQEGEQEELTPFAAEYITYRKVGDRATNMPSAERYGEMRNGKYILLDNRKYKYDESGNITEVLENGKLAARYTYDKLGRLVREDNKQLGKTVLYSYDNNGNILSKREFAFTLKDTGLLEELDSADILYSYDDDRLLSYGEESFDYDELGNPITYRGKACEWEKGRQLVGYDGNAFEYDGLGRRISKNTTQYTYDSNGNLIKQSNGENTLEFVYDNKGVVGVTHITSSKTKKYFFRRNAQGDVIALLDNTGKVVVRYVYDVWGNHEAYDENGSEITSATHIGNLNPFRYRGYYYDTETKLYFLKTRYYDSEIGRFMTIDGVEYLDPESINGLNLYAYCGNNPVMAVDPNGTAKWWQWLLFGIGAALVVAAAVVLTVATFGVGTAAFGATMLGSIALHASVGTLIGAGVGSVLGAAGGAIYSASTGADLGDSILSGFLIGFGVGAIAGAAIGGIHGAATFTPNSMIGNTVKLGQVAANQGGKITGYSAHGAMRMAERGMGRAMAKLTVKFGTSILQNSGKVAYLTQKAFVVLNAAGTVVTAYGQSYFDNGMQALVKLLFGG